MLASPEGGLDARMPFIPDVPNPLAAYVETYPDGTWTVNENYAFATRIYGDGVVPEPATMTLVGLGLMGLWLRQRRCKG
jgi:hypothetical protein